MRTSPSVKKFLITAAIALACLVCVSLTLTRWSRDGSIVEATVTRVVDGDTIFVAVRGQGYQSRRVRILGVDTPETVHPNKPVQFYGPEASAFAKAYLTGRRVWLEYDVSPTDRYHRHLAYVWLIDPNANTNASKRDAAGAFGEQEIRSGMFNAWLLLGGYGKTMNIEPNSRYSALFEKFQSEARSSRRGLWQ